MSVTLFCSSILALKAEMAIGVDCSFCSRNWAVTTTSSAGCALAAAAWAPTAIELISADEASTVEAISHGFCAHISSSPSNSRGGAMPTAPIAGTLRESGSEVLDRCD